MIERGLWSLLWMLSSAGRGHRMDYYGSNFAWLLTVYLNLSKFG